MMDLIWKLNRKYDDLDKDYPLHRFIYFMLVFMAILSMPLAALIITGEDQPIVILIMWTLLFFLFIVRVIWLRKNKVL